MLQGSLKRVFEFFLRDTPDAGGETNEIIDLRKQMNRLMRGAMPEAERASFFRAIRLNAQAVELLASEIQRKSSAATDKYHLE
jgi:hypothetical protein